MSMMQAQRHHLRLTSAASFLSPSLPPPPFPHHLYLPTRPTNNQYSSVCCSHRAWLAQISDQLITAPAPGPIKLPPSISSLLSSSDNPDTLQTAASFLITGAFTLFLFQTLQSSAKRAKEKRLGSRSVKEEAMESLRKATGAPLQVQGKKKKRSPPSPDQTLLGAVIAAAFGIMLYKFTTTVEFTLNHQPLSANYSVRQITITIRTIINGLCYLATFVFGFNSLGLFLYSGQLAMNSFAPAEGEPQLTSYSKLPDVDTCKKEDQSSDTTQN